MKKNKYVTESFINAITKKSVFNCNDHMSIEKLKIYLKNQKSIIFYVSTGLFL